MWTERINVANLSSYVITIRKIANIDNEPLFQATCDNFPDLAEWAETYDEARELIIDSVTTSDCHFWMFSR